MKKIDKAAYQERLDRITAIFKDMMAHATEQATYRCPYKNRFDECTARFGCRNQRKPRESGGLLMCGGDDKLDYRGAWETEEAPHERPEQSVESTDQNPDARPSAMRQDAVDTGMDEADRRGRAAPNVTMETSSNTPGGTETGGTETGGTETGGTETGGTVTDGTTTRPAVIGKTIFDYADDLAVQVPTSCFRNGICHECIVEIQQGMEGLVPRSKPESFLRENYRLACQARVIDPNVDIAFAPLRRTPKILTVTEEKETPLDPLVTRRGDAVFYDGEQVDRFRGHVYGLAIDLGTTTVVMDFVDLETGRSVHVCSFENPQRFGGSDVMHRISYDGGFEDELWNAIINAVNHEIMDWCERTETTRQEIYEIVVAGNSTMRDLFFRLDVQSIGQKPYKSLIENEYLAGDRDTTALTIGTRRLGLRANPKARVYGLPIIASHVGGDVTADLATVDLAARPGVSMLVDVGTNTEVVVAGNGRMVTASCPAGPAFEGGGIKYGMPGYEGAIETLKWEDGRFDWRTIGDSTPQGICGSGLIDLLAELRRHGMMSPKGVFPDRKQFEVPVVAKSGITLSRQDASNLAQAKAANYCGQYIVLRAFGVAPGDVDRLFLAGGFANYVDVRNAIDIGFLAPVPEDRIFKVGNAAVQGAREILLSHTRRKEMETLVRDIEHIELETTPDFFEIFVEACQFKPMPGVLV